MYIVPAFISFIAYLLFPSIFAAAGLAIFLIGYQWFAGQAVYSRYLWGQLAFRILSVKLVGMNGSVVEVTHKVHALLTPDEPNAAELRGLLRDAAACSGAGWRRYAKIVRKVYGKKPGQILDRFDKLVLQLRTQPRSITVQTQERLIEIAKLWKIGPSTSKEIFARNNVKIGPPMLNWTA